MHQKPTHPNLTIVSLLLVLCVMIISFFWLSLQNTFTPTPALEQRLNNSYNQ